MTIKMYPGDSMKYEKLLRIALGDIVMNAWLLKALI